MLQVVNLKKEFGPKLLFEAVSFTLSKGEKVGLVGRNGCGKSTLLKIIMGKESSSSGSVQLPKNYQLAWLEQHIKFTQETILQEVASVLNNPELERFKAEKILTGLGFKPAEFTYHPSKYSGGMQLRINLAKALLAEPDLLLLDEPTNYLDITSIRWLKKIIKAMPCEVIIISHDRDFIDSVCTTVMGLYRSQLIKITGTTEKYYQFLVEQEENYEKTRLNQEKKIKDAKKFIEKFRAKARQASLAQSRMKMLEKMNVLTELASERDFNLFFRYKEIPAKFIAECDDVSFHYPDKPIMTNFSLSLKQDDKIAIIGKNGSGKSTLLNLLAGELTPHSGVIKMHHAVAVGFFGQTNINRLASNQTILSEILTESNSISTQDARDLAGAMLFSNDDANKKIEVLSGGEKSRVMLAKIMASERNLLLLDEPTNHLDQESIEILIDELNNFQGAVVMVVHSEHILRNFANRLIIFDNNQVEVFEGNYQDFLRLKGWSEEIDVNSANATEAKLTKKDYKKLRTELINERAAKLRPIKAELEKLESEIIKAETEKTLVDQALIQASEASQGEKITALSIQSAQLEKKIETDFLRLEELTNDQDKIMHDYAAKLSQLDLI
jgi:ATP-binding cassette, subfamily F, member 3